VIAPARVTLVDIAVARVIVDLQVKGIIEAPNRGL
jgi:hypothetical protein